VCGLSHFAHDGPCRGAPRSGIFRLSVIRAGVAQAIRSLTWVVIQMKREWSGIALERDLSPFAGDSLSKEPAQTPLRHGASDGEYNDDRTGRTRVRS
jgi:hypothetical protein